MKNIALIKKQIVGLTIEEANLLLKEYKVRETKVNGNHLATTLDYRTDRINVATVDNKITEVLSIG